MSDNPERSIETMRRQLEPVCEADEELVEKIVSCDEKDEICSIEELSEEDTEILENVHIYGALM